MSEQPASVDDYIAGFPSDVAERLQQVRAVIVAQVPAGDASAPEERMRYGIAAVMLGGRYALHFAGWKHHIGLYPVPTLPADLEAKVAPLRQAKDTVVLKHALPLPVELVGRIAAAIVAQRAGGGEPRAS
ncbi:iron chaperone [Agrococcus sp. Ld7]|uniref:iron chaperone n=1 Tax=Agrococcus sp. Ld7 TaxID=649148 RepID=UPI00386B625D